MKTLIKAISVLGVAVLPFAATAATTTLVTAISPQAGQLGSNISVTGTCAMSTSGNVSFSILQNNKTYPLTAVATGLNSSGAFSSTVNLVNDSTATTGNPLAGMATLVVSCPDGSSVARPIQLTAAGTGNTTGSLAMPAITGTTGTTSGTGQTSLIPQGGVRAGSGPVALELATLAVLFGGLLAVRKLSSSNRLG